MNLADGNIQVVDNEQDLEQLCRGLALKTWIAVDTEFIREKTYKPQLCLIQIASDEHLACIDTLAFDDIDPLVDVIFDRKIVKIFHAAKQDLEIFYWLRGAVPGPVFDTQIAAPLLGYNEQIGYGNLVKAALGIELAKSHSRADWSRRPLPQAQLRYAADDVVYLARLYQMMQPRLTELNRLEWLDEDFSALENPDLYDKPAEDMWLRVRGIHKYKGKTLAVIQKLTAWREHMAQEKNLPRNWLLKDDVIIDIARQLPESFAELQHIRGLAESTAKRYGADLIASIIDAQKSNPSPLPPYKKKIKLSPSQDAIVDLLTTLSKTHSEALYINASVLAPRKELEKLISDPNSSALSRGWRKTLIGEQLLDLLNGNISVRIEDMRIKLEPFQS